MSRSGSQNSGAVCDEEMTATSEEEEAVKRFLSGTLSLEDVPEIPPRVVKVYLSSTGIDTVTERNTLIQEVYSQLREYCRQTHGLEFQIVDLSWGIPHDDARLNHTHAQFKLRELKKCQSVSAGPSYITLIGQRYGERRLPATIPLEQYELIQRAMKTHRGRETRSAPLLDEWYIRDDNALNTEYILRDPAEVYKSIIEEDEEERKEGMQKWKDTEKELRRLIHKAADFNLADGLIDEETKQKFTMSEHEGEVLAGIRDQPMPEDKCIAIFRTIIDLKNYIDEPKAAQFSEIVYDERKDQLEFEKTAEDDLTRMRNMIKQFIPEKSIFNYEVLWRYEEVISPKLHQDYLNRLCDDLRKRIIEMIDHSARSRRFGSESELCDEVLQHLDYCKMFSRRFCGREDIMASLRKYVLGDANQPMVVYGDEGSGKTSIMSKLVAEFPDIIPSSLISVVRYIGYTPSSTDIRLLLSSICKQVCTVLERKPEAIPSEYKELQKFFHDLLSSVPTNTVLVITLDGLDNILPDNNAHVLSWLPGTLEPNVKIILATHPQKHDVLTRLQGEVIKNNNSFIKVGELSEEECCSMMSYYLNVSGRQITDEQTNVFSKCFAECSAPLFVRLLAEEARLLHSGTDCSELTLPSSTTEAINNFFGRVEKKHGQVLVSRAIAYMVASQTGLSDSEMEDLLSLDEDVMNDVFRDYHPPVRRLPCSVWLKLRGDLECFLFTREIDGITVYSWLHEAFLDVCTKRYMSDKDTMKELFSMLADYYLGTWATKAKPVQLSKHSDNILMMPCGGEADRLVPSQPLTFESADGTIRFNRRKYDQVPRHLYLSGRLDELNELVLFNYDWLYNKIKALSLQHIVSDFSLNPGVEATLVEETLRIAQTTIEKDINNMGPEIAGHLLPYYPTHKNIRELIKQCDTNGLKHCALIPNFPYLQVPGSSLQHLLENPNVGDFFILGTDDRYLISKSRDDSYIYIYDILLGELKDKIFTSSGDLYITPNGKYFIIVDHVTEKTIKIHNAKTGDFVGQLIVMNHVELKPKEKYHMGVVSLTNERMCVIVSTESSYLCIADIESCKFLQIVGLDGRTSVCHITANGRYVFCNSNEFLVSYDLYSLDHISTVPTNYPPNALDFTKDGLRGFATNNKERMLYIFQIYRGAVETMHIVSLEEDMDDDKVRDVKISPTDYHVLIRGDNNIVVYHRISERVCTRLPRPPNVPKEFKLPKSYYKELKFTQAEFTRDGHFVIGTLFRNIYIWQVPNGNLITNILAPVGIVDKLLVVRQRSQIVTHLEDAKTIQVWNIDEAVSKVHTRDRLTDPISEVHVTADNAYAYVKCYDSDAIGVIDMQTGSLLDLLTHDSPVHDFAISPSGQYVLVSTRPKKKGVATKLWDMNERRIVRESGNTLGYCIAVNGISSMVFVCQDEMVFDAPYHINIYHFMGDTFTETRHPLALKFVLQKPFVTLNDRYLIILTANGYDKDTSTYDTPTICAFSMEGEMGVNYYTPESFAAATDVKTILDLRPSQRNPFTVAVLYTKDKALEENNNGSGLSFLVLDVCSGAILTLCDPFLMESIERPKAIVYSSDFSFCMDEHGERFDITTGQYASLPLTKANPNAIALNGTVVISNDNSLLEAVRISDGKTIATCDVHSKICYTKLCSDERTLIVGCEDGTVVSYILIDPTIDDSSSVLGILWSRCDDNVKSETDGRHSRIWDKVEQENCPEYSRPPSAARVGPMEKSLLSTVKPVPKFRPGSDTLLCTNQRATTCAVM